MAASLSVPRNGRVDLSTAVPKRSRSGTADRFRSQDSSGCKRFRSRQVSLPEWRTRVLNAQATFCAPQPRPALRSFRPRGREPEDLPSLTFCSRSDGGLRPLAPYSNQIKPSMDFRIAAIERQLGADTGTVALAILAPRQASPRRRYARPKRPCSPICRLVAQLQQRRRTSPRPAIAAAALHRQFNHSIWFHRAFRPDQWIHFDSGSPCAEGGRGCRSPASMTGTAHAGDRDSRRLDGPFGPVTGSAFCPCYQAKII